MNWVAHFLIAAVRALILSSVIVFVVFGSMMMMSTWDGLLFPVARIDVTGGEWKGDEYVMDGFLDKYRSCEYVGMTWRDTVTGREMEIRTPPRPPGQSVSRPAVLHQPFIGWRMINAPTDGGEFVIYTHHRCQDLWATFSKAGEVIIPGRGSR